MSDRVTMTYAPPMRRFSLRARDPALLASIIGLPLPTRIGETEGNIACLGPDEYYARLPHDADLPRGAGQAVSIVDVSDRAVGIIVEGAGARTVLSSGCPLDLEHFAVGRTTRTIYETVEIILYRETDTRWHIDVWRSFAPWLWAALAKAASD
jgi:sarcosine oxidase, subunit gamma